MGKHLSYLAIALVLCLTAPVHADPYADAVIEFLPGAGAGFGQDEFPEIVLGAPQGTGEMSGGTDVLSLGDGGSITLEFVDNRVINGDGPDFIVFENAFYAGGNPENTFAEVAFVEVSADGETFYRFPNDYDPEGTPINKPTNWSGFAGVHPCLSHPDNGIDPTDPLVAGGDAFDLDDVGLDEIRFVRIIDTGEGETVAHDDDGDEIYDPGMPGEPYAGSDLDAIAAVYSIEIATPTPTPSPSSTATPTPDPTTTVTPTPTPTAYKEFEFKVSLTETLFEKGDLFRLTTEIRNPDAPIQNVMQYLILDVYGQYYFHPHWHIDAVFTVLDIPVGVSQSTILEFIWPDVPGHARELIIWGGLINQELSILGSISYVEFSY